MSDIKIEAKEIKMVDVEMLIPNPKNNNMHPPEQYERLKKIITRQGFRVPIEVSNQSGFIVCGHLRYEVACQLGMKQVPVVYQDFETPALEYAHLTAENEIARWAELDKHSVYEELKTLELDDIELLGLEDFEIPDIEELDPQTDEDEVPEVEHPITRRGDIWLLGKHRLMCGDSTMIDDVERLMNGEKADFVYTDPPYGMNLDTNYNNNIKKVREKRDYKKVAGDNEDFSKDLINTIFYFDYVKEMFIWGFDYFAELIPNRNEGSNFVWHKADGLEHCTLGSEFELCWSKNKHKKKVFKVTQKGFFGHNKKDDGSKRIHPTQKNVALHLSVFNEWCEGLINCVDLYGGSGSTLIACEKSDKKCFTIELDEYYCDLIINRYQVYSGKKATLESTGQTYEELQQERL